MSYFNLVNCGLICTLDYVLVRDSAITEYKMPLWKFLSDLLSHTCLHSIGCYKSIDASCKLGLGDIKPIWCGFLALYCLETSCIIMHWLKCFIWNKLPKCNVSDLIFFFFWQIWHWIGQVWFLYKLFILLWLFSCVNWIKCHAFCFTMGAYKLYLCKLFFMH